MTNITDTGNKDKPRGLYKPRRPCYVIIVSIKLEILLRFYGLQCCMNKKYGVSDVAQVLGLTPGALHYFEKEGLINVEKEENGRRYYSVADIFRLLSYTKYRSMGFPMKTVVRQFSGWENDRSVIAARVVDRRDYARAQAEYYGALADAIDRHLESINQIPGLLNNYEFAKSKEHLLLYDAECGWISKNRDSQLVAQKWVKAMPAVRLSAVMKSVDDRDARLGYTVLPEDAKRLDLPMELNVLTLPATSCLHTVVATDDSFSDDPAVVFDEPVRYALSRGFEISGMPWGTVLLVEVAPGSKLRPYVEVWVPIK